VYNLRHVEVNIIRKRRRHSARHKFKVVLEAAKGTKTVNQLASEFELHPSQISEWKHRLLDDGAGVFKTSTAQRELTPPVDSMMRVECSELSFEVATGEHGVHIPFQAMERAGRCQLLCRRSDSRKAT